VREKSSDIYILTQTLRRKNYMVAYQNILFWIRTILFSLSFKNE
jgi:hypothetical protein